MYFINHAYYFLIISCKQHIIYFFIIVNQNINQVHIINNITFLIITMICYLLGYYD